MKIKFILLAIAVTFVFAACGSKEQTTTETPEIDIAAGITGEQNEQNETPSQNNETNETNEENFPVILDSPTFAEAMESMVSAYEGLVSVLEFMISKLQEVETDEELTEWHEVFSAIHQDIINTLEILTAMVTADAVPEDQMERFMEQFTAIYLIDAAVEVILSELSDVSVADEDIIAASLESFEINLMAARMLIQPEE